MKIASFFSGAGGLDLGFTNAGFELAFANDKWEGCWETFEKNHGFAINKMETKMKIVTFGILGLIVILAVYLFTSSIKLDIVGDDYSKELKSFSSVDEIKNFVKENSDNSGVYSNGLARFACGANR